MPKRTKSSQRWLQEHESDVFVKRAREAGYRSRALFKLEDIQRTDRLLRPGGTLVDLGAAPGGWSQYAAKLLQGRGRIVALDILPMDAINGVEFIQGDFTEDAVLEQLLSLLAGDRPELVMSDMAPNTTGIATVDQDRSLHLAELALDFAAKVLALDTLVDRLKLLSRGQTWVVKRLDAVADDVTDPDRRKELAEMRREHVDNVAWCDQQVAELEHEAVSA